MFTLPQPFVEMLATLPGHEEVAHALTSRPSPATIRLNPLKPLAQLPPADAVTVPWEPSGYYLDERPAYTFHPGIYDGRFYVQDASSMIVGEAVRRIVAEIAHPVRYLDACAAPGGKSIAALTQLPPGSFLLANEYDSSRAAALVDNLQRWGMPGYAVGVNDARRLRAVGPVFDIVAADVPCSGEGMMRKNPVAVSQWSPRLIRECAALQRQILESLWQTVVPGGWLIYSTCTFNTTENEKNVEWMCEQLNAEPVDLGLNDFPGVLPGVHTDIPCARFLPGKIEGEGQFVAVLRKPGTADHSASTKTFKQKKTNPLPDWVEGDFVRTDSQNGNIYAIDSRHAQFVRHLSGKINIVTPGIHVALTKGRDIIPAQALATSLCLRNDAFPAVETDYATALSYLRGNALNLDTEVPRGIVLITHGQYRLGWAKNLGSRANNLFPASSRILSTVLPDAEPTLFRAAPMS